MQQAMFKRLRTHSLVVWLFALISLGQAHPFAVAWSLEAPASCQCRERGQGCVHGCKLQRSQSHAHEHNRHEHAEHVDKEAGPTTPTSTSSSWVSPNCNRQKQAKILSLESDPFLVSAPQILYVRILSHLLFRISPPLPDWHPELSTPPPRTALSLS